MTTTAPASEGRRGPFRTSTAVRPGDAADFVSGAVSGTPKNQVSVRLATASGISLVVYAGGKTRLSYHRGSSTGPLVAHLEEEQALPGVSVQGEDMEHPLLIDLEKHKRRRRAHGFWSGVAGLLQLRPPRRRAHTVEESLERAFADIALAVRDLDSEPSKRRLR